MTLLSLLADATHILLVLCAAAAQCSLSQSLLSARTPRSFPTERVYIRIIFLFLDCVFPGARLVLVVVELHKFLVTPLFQTFPSPSSRSLMKILNLVV